MAEVKQPRLQAEESEVVVDRARDFWSRNNRTILMAAAAIIILGGGYLAYKYLIKAPQEKKAAEALFKAEEYFRIDSTNLALKGDGQNPGFEKIISQYGGTKAGNLARFYAGALSLKSGNMAKAVDYLEDFKSDAAQINARAYKLLGDAYADQGKNDKAFNNYKKAARTFESDENASSEYLFLAAYFADKVLKNKDEAVTLYKELRKKYPQTNFAGEAEKYLAQNGVYVTED
jgi:predicted negative regulator of RcsB-dependent stress response